MADQAVDAQRIDAPRGYSWPPSPGVDAQVGSAGDRQFQRAAVVARSPRIIRRHALELALDGTLVGLACPACEARRRRTRSSALRSSLAAAPAAARSDELEEDHLGRVALTLTDLEDARVATGTLGVARSHLDEQLVDRELVLGERREGLAAGVQVARLASVISFSISGLTALALASVVLMRSCSISSLLRFISRALRWAESRLSFLRVFWWRMGRECR